MSKRVLAILVAALLAVGIFSAVANAGVEGDFTFHIIMWPQSVQSEYSKFDFDLEAVLNLNITISGLTIMNHLTMGNAGIENYIAQVNTILGALNFTDVLAFAKPYIGMFLLDYYWTGWGIYFPMKWFNPNIPGYGSYPIGNVLFVKKRASAEITIGGLTVTNLAMFEDINFPTPWATPAPLPPVIVPYVFVERQDFMAVDPTTGVETCVEIKTLNPDCTVTYIRGNPGICVVTAALPACPAGTSIVVPAASLYGAGPNTYTTDDQVFRFGDIVGISGTTVSGIKVTAKTGICADWRIRPARYTFMGGKHSTSKYLEHAYNVIKKYAWWESVCTNEKLEFTKEYLAIEGIHVSDILNLDVYSLIQFVPLNTYIAIESTVNLFGIGQLYIWTDLLTPKNLVLEPMYDPVTGWYMGPSGNPIVTLQLGPGLAITWLDRNRTLAMDAAPAPADRIIIDQAMTLQNVSFANYIVTIVGTGLMYMHNEVDIPISFPEPIGSLTIDAEWYCVGYPKCAVPSTLLFEDIDFGVTKSFGEHNEFSFDVAFNEDGLYGADFRITVLFSL